MIWHISRLFCGDRTFFFTSFNIDCHMPDWPASFSSGLEKNKGLLYFSVCGWNLIQSNLLYSLMYESTEEADRMYRAFSSSSEMQPATFK